MQAIYHLNPELLEWLQHKRSNEMESILVQNFMASVLQSQCYIKDQ